MTDRLTPEERAVLEAADTITKRYECGLDPGLRCKPDKLALIMAVRALRESRQKWRAKGAYFIVGSNGEEVECSVNAVRDRVLALLNAGEKALEEK